MAHDCLTLYCSACTDAISIIKILHCVTVWSASSFAHFRHDFVLALYPKRCTRKLRTKCFHIISQNHHVVQVSCWMGYVCLKIAMGKKEFNKSKLPWTIGTHICTTRGNTWSWVLSLQGGMRTGRSSGNLPEFLNLLMTFPHGFNHKALLHNHDNKQQLPFTYTVTEQQHAWPNLLLNQKQQGQIYRELCAPTSVVPASTCFHRVFLHHFVSFALCTLHLVFSQFVLA